MAWLKSIFVKQLTVSNFEEKLKDCKLPSKVITKAVKEFEEYKTKLERGEFVWTGGLLSFIPNLEDADRLESYRQVIETMYSKCEKNENDLVGPSQFVKFMSEYLSQTISVDDAKAKIDEVDLYSKGGVDSKGFFNLLDGKVTIPDHVLNKITVVKKSQDNEPEKDDSEENDDEDSSEDDAEYDETEVVSETFSFMNVKNPANPVVPATQTVGEKKSQKLEGLEQLFELFDVDKDGFIGISDVRASFGQLTGEDVTEDEAVAMVLASDKDKDGKLNFQEFKLMMEKTMLS